MQKCCVCKGSPDSNISQETRLYTATQEIRKFKKGDLVCGLCTIELKFTAQEAATFRHLPDDIDYLYKELKEILREG